MTPTATVPMVGRQAELRVLLDAYEAGRNGRPRAIVIRGEAGIGKTRLLEEFRARTRPDAAETRLRAPAPRLVTAWGQCVDLGPIGAPITPIRRVLREIYTAVGDERFREAAGSPAVVSTLAALLPDLVGDAATAPSGGDYVAEAIERIVESLSAEFHLLLVIEDLHWADAATLALLKTLAVTLRRRHVTLICTYRSDDVGRGHPLRAVLAELDRSRAVTGLEIGRLADEDLAEHVRMLSGGTVSPEELDAVAARSEGVPFFVEELVDLRGQPLPDTLRELVLARFVRLSPLGQDVVGLVAVGGVQVDAALLSEVHRGDAHELRDGLREAVAAGVLVSDDDGYSFRHALIQEAVHDDLLPNDRVEAHTAYARALQRRVDGGEAALAAEAAVHWLAARDVVRAFDATVAARAWSIAANAPSAAVKLGERLLELWSQVPEARARASVSRAALALSIAGDYYDIGETERALRSAEAGIAFAEPDERLLRAELLRTTAARQRSTGRDPDAIVSLRTARDLLDENGDAAEQALLAKVDALLAVTDQSPASPAVLDHAVSLAEASRDDEALAHALYMRAWLDADSGRIGASVVDLTRAMQLNADISTHHIVANNLVDTLGRLGRYREALEVGRASYDETVQVGRERGLGAYVNANVAEIELNLGEAHAGVTRAERCLLLFPANAIFQSFALRLLALAAVYDDDAVAAAAFRERVAARQGRVDNDPEEKIGWVFVDGTAAARDVRDGAPIASLLTIAPRIAELLDGALPGLSQRLLPLAAWICHLAPDARDLLVPGIERLSARPVDGPTPALLALTRAYLDGGVAPWREALVLAAEGAVPGRYVHTARLELAEALIEDGDRDGAAELLELVADSAPGRGAALVARWAGEVAARAGIPLATADAAPAAEAVASPASILSSLTPRERQVLALVAEGLTNPQIGQRLFISPKTASVHVSAILAKIGATNRAEAAAVYAESELPRT